MNGWQRMVREFHARMGQPIVDKPTIPDQERKHLRICLMNEEFLETCDAMHTKNIVEIADGLADLAYVLLGTAIEYGIDLEPVFAEVHRTNMLKLPGNMRADGKIGKPADWQPPRIKEILQAQIDDDVWPGSGDAEG